MQHRKKTNFLVAFSVAVIVLSIYSFNVKAATDESRLASDSVQVTTVAANFDPSQLLPDRLANSAATGTLNKYGVDQLSELVGKDAIAYGEYHVVAAYERDYATARIKIFQTEGFSSAYGLFTYCAVDPPAKPSDVIGWGSSEAGDTILFWKKNYVVSITSKNGRLSAEARKFASAIASSVGEGTPVLPLVVSSLPATNAAPASVRYFLGPIALGKYVEHASEQFSFDGHAEAVLGQYPKDSSSSSSTSLLIIEYHTPQFAYDAMKRTGDFLTTLPEEQQNRIILKREGNYLVESTNVQDRERADQLVSAVQYPYQVKWLRNPLWPTNDPFRTQKAAEMLLSTFGVIGILIGTVLVGGGSFGAFVFIKRRRRLREVFTDAGGMLHLDIEPLFDRRQAIEGDFRRRLNPRNGEDF